MCDCAAGFLKCNDDVCVPACSPGEVDGDACGCGGDCCEDGKVCTSSDDCLDPCSEGTVDGDDCGCGTTTCSDGQVCTSSDDCLEPCGEGLIDGDDCACGTTTCSDGQVCTSGGTCIDACSDASDCDDSDACTQNVCNDTTGLCEHPTVDCSGQADTCNEATCNSSDTTGSPCGSTPTNLGEECAAHAICKEGDSRAVCECDTDNGASEVCGGDACVALCADGEVSGDSCDCDSACCADGQACLGTTGSRQCLSICPDGTVSGGSRDCDGAICQSGDTCVGTAGSRVCQRACTTDSDCDDSDACTVGTCNTTSGLCEYTAVVCPDSDDPCNKPVCISSPPSGSPCFTEPDNLGGACGTDRICGVVAGVGRCLCEPDLTECGGTCVPDCQNGKVEGGSCGCGGVCCAEGMFCLGDPGQRQCRDHRPEDDQDNDQFDGEPDECAPGGSAICWNLGANGVPEQFSSLDGVLRAVWTFGAPVVLKYYPNLCETWPMFCGISAGEGLYGLRKGDQGAALPPLGLRPVAGARMLMVPAGAPSFVNVSLHYSEDAIAGIAESGLRLFYFHPSEQRWVELPSSIDPIANLVTVIAVDVSAFMADPTILGLFG